MFRPARPQSSPPLPRPEVCCSSYVPDIFVASADVAYEKAQNPGGVGSDEVGALCTPHPSAGVRKPTRQNKEGQRVEGKKHWLEI